jgi:hypothetical protein
MGFMVRGHVQSNMRKVVPMFRKLIAAGFVASTLFLGFAAPVAAGQSEDGMAALSAMTMQPLCGSGAPSLTTALLAGVVSISNRTIRPPVHTVGLAMITEDGHEDISFRKRHCKKHM